MVDRPTRMGLTRRGVRAVPSVALVVGAVGATSPWWRGRPRSIHTVAASVAPWSALVGFPVAVLAAYGRRHTLAGAGLVLGGSGLALRRWVRGTAPAPAPAAVDRTTGAIRVGHFNVWYENRQPTAAAVTVAALDVDVLVLSEMTPELTQVFTAAGLTDQYRHRIDRSRSLADGLVVWSRHPLEELAVTQLSHERIRARVAHPDGPFIIDGLHTQSPIHHVRTWTSDLDVLAGERAPDEPAVIVGDFNAAWTHRPFRRIVARGWRDAHRALGLGTSNSWRADKRPLPPFVRIDHALVNDGLEVVAIDDVDLPGSDHRGFVVTLRCRR
jgi:endonuclease/exonuclease/phosphatase (EEP) superfamily protein YafD